MRRIALPLAAATLAAAAVVATSDAAHTAATTTIHLQVKTTKVITVHNGRPTTKRVTAVDGDTVLVDAKLLQRGKTVGREAVVCEIIDPDFQLCTISNRLAKGEVMYSGANDPNGRVYHEAITGGTGAYLGARGVADTDLRPSPGTIALRIAK